MGELHDQIAYLLGFAGFEKEEVAAARGLQIGLLAAIDGVCAGDDAAAGGLAEDFGELHAGQGTADKKS